MILLYKILNYYFKLVDYLIIKATSSILDN